MDKNTIIGFILMALVLIGFSYLNRPSEEEIQARMAEQEQAEKQAKADQAAKPVAFADTLSQHDIALLAQSGALDETVKANDTVVSVADIANGAIANLTPAQKADALANVRAMVDAAERYGTLGRHLNGDSTTVTLANDVIAIDIATKGASIAQATLLNYNTYVGGDTALVKPFRPGLCSMGFVLTSANQRIDTRDFYFQPSEASDSSVTMRLNLGGDAFWAIRYTLHKGSYLVGMEILQNQMTSIIPASVASIDMNWHQQLGRNEVGRTFEERNSGIYYKYVGDKPDNLNENSDDSDNLNQRVKWVSFKNQFFSSVLIPRTSFTSADVKSTIIKDNPALLKDLDMHATLDYSPSSPAPVAFDLFIGPNLYPLLASLDDTVNTDEKLQLTHLIPLGWSLFRWINTIIIIPVFTFLGSFISNYGIIILLLTIFIKIILFPFTYKSYLSQAKMRILSPEINAINEKYPGQENAMTRQQKTMELYSKAGASPFSGCLPMMLQMPVLIAMFSFFPSCIELRGQAFLWAKDLSAPDVIFTLPFSIPFYGSHVSLFCLLMTVTNIIYTQINMQNQPSSSSMPGMKWMMYLMPLMFLFFFNDYASGLSYYYFLSLLITIIQTWVFRRCVNEEKMRRQMAENASKPKKKSGFMARLEEAQRQQQAMLREQQKRQNKGRR